jgi:hypothetical protein
MEEGCAMKFKGPSPDEVWRHYKGVHYTVLCLARLERDDEQLVVYRSWESGQVYARPVHEWHGEVHTPTGRLKRFVKVRDL